eukprot:3211812-Pleurochrysis_carterae.AAC.1
MMLPIQVHVGREMCVQGKSLLVGPTGSTKTVLVYCAVLAHVEEYYSSKSQGIAGDGDGKQGEEVDRGS